MRIKQSALNGILLMQKTVWIAIRTNFSLNITVLNLEESFQVISVHVKRRDIVLYLEKPQGLNADPVLIIGQYYRS